MYQCKWQAGNNHFINIYIETANSKQHTLDDVIMDTNIIILFISVCIFHKTLLYIHSSLL